MKGLPPRKRLSNLYNDTLLLSGLEVMKVNRFTNFVNIGERCNVAGSRRFNRLITKGKYEVRRVYLVEQLKGSLRSLSKLSMHFDL